MKIEVIIHEEADGGYWAEVPALPGCVTEGDTYDELLSNINDAVESWLAVASKRRTAEFAHESNGALTKRMEVSL